MSDINNIKLNVSELFYSMQGEGGRVGTMNVFIRLSGCPVQRACMGKAGVNCDTDFQTSKEYTVKELSTLIEQMSIPKCQNIIWTGGEPAFQLTDEIVDYFQFLGFYQAIETSGVKSVPQGLNYISVSPKVAEHVIEKNFKDLYVNELRYVRHSGQTIPDPSIEADRYFLSPHFDGNILNVENLDHCSRLIREIGRDGNSKIKWELSIQIHKLMKIL